MYKCRFTKTNFILTGLSSALCNSKGHNFIKRKSQTFKELVAIVFCKVVKNQGKKGEEKNNRYSLSVFELGTKSKKFSVLPFFI